MTTTTLPTFKGKPLIDDTSQVNFLEGDFGKAVVEEYDERVRADYGDAAALKYVLRDVEGYTYKAPNFVQGSNPFAVVLVNKIIREQGLRTATQADLERILKVKALDLTQSYVDSALVLRTGTDSYRNNDSLAGNLFDQVYEILARRPEERLPVMISLSDLDLVKAGWSPYGLAFKIRDDAGVVYAPILDMATRPFSSEDIDERTGLPTRVGEGNRVLGSRKDGLSGLNLNMVMVLASHLRNLDGSSSDGRVVVVSGSVRDLKKAA